MPFVPSAPATEHGRKGDSWAVLFNSSAWQAMAESAAGSAALADADLAAARQRFEAARARYEAAGQPYWTDRAGRLAALVPA